MPTLAEMLSGKPQVAPTPGPLVDSLQNKFLGALRPLNPGEERQNPDGSVSSELTMTFEADGKWVNVPSLWMSPTGPKEFDGKDAFRVARQYEKKTGKRFPRFATQEDAIKAAGERSAGGAIALGELANAPDSLPTGIIDRMRRGF